MHRKLALVVVLLISSLACGFINTVTPVSTLIPSATQLGATQGATKTPSSSPAGTQPTLSALTTTTTPEEPTKTPYPTSVLNAQMKSEIDLIQTQVVQERELQPKYPVPVVLLTTDQLRTNITDDFLADYTDEDSRNDVYELSAIGLLDPNFDFRTFYINLLSEGIEGYYDPDAKEMFVVSDQGFTGPAHFTYAHEFTHALQDQTYDIRKGLNYSEDNCEKDSEYCAAVQAMTEGDATLSQFTWFQNDLSSEEQQQIAQYYNNLKTPVYDSAPDFLKQDTNFPYVQGLTFIQYFHDQGGWQAVNDLYKNPPVSTEQILHPERYPDDKPIPVDLPDLASALGTGWREVSRNQMGEFYTYLILAHGINPLTRLDDASAQAASAGWGGDEYLVFHNDSANTTAFVMETVWDTTNDAGEFSNALRKSLNSRFALQATQQGDTFTWSYSSGYSSLLLSGSTTIWIVAPDSATAQTISTQVQP